jgi:putative transposase
MASNVGAARFIYNWGLGLVESRLHERIRLGEQALVEGLSKREAETLAASVVVPWNLYALRREWSATKDCVAPWWAANSKEAYSSGLHSLARALRGYVDSASGKRTGPRMGWPRRKKRRSRASCRFTTGSFGVVDAHHIALPRIAPASAGVKTHEPTTKLATRLADATARILSAILSLEAGRWFVSFTCEVCREALPRPTGVVVGVDLGVSSLAALSTGEKVPNPKALCPLRQGDGEAVQALLPPPAEIPASCPEPCGACPYPRQGGPRAP